MKQKNKIRLLLVAVLAGLSVMGYAQGKWCKGSVDGYQIVQVTAPSDQGATFQWKKNGEVVSGETSANLAISATTLEAMSAGKYTYIRYAKKPDCPDLVASNAFTVEVLTCGDITSEAGVGAKGTITDARDKKVYKIVKMPDGKVWMAENLNYQKDLTFNSMSNYANGEVFTSMANGVPAIGSFWCPPVGGTLQDVATSQNTCNVYGALYTWETAMSENGKGPWLETNVSANYFPNNSDEASKPSAGANKNSAQNNGQGICPAGWHVPTDYEWANLLDKVETEGANGTYTSQIGTGWFGEDAGKKMKSASTYIGADPGDGSWADNDPNRGTDASGFGAVPAGGRYNNGTQFGNRGTLAIYWSSSVGSNSHAWYREFHYINAQVGRNLNYRSYGFAVRCVKD
jgi:uncharacterized protein (TIGR02145 family)